MKISVELNNDSTAILSYFDAPQDDAAYGVISQIEDSDERWKIFLGSLPDAFSKDLPPYTGT